MIDSDKNPTTPQKLPTSGESWIPHLALVITTAGWGLSFSLMRSWQTGEGPATPFPGLVSGLVLILVRMVLAFILFVAIQPRLMSQMGAKEWVAGFAVGFPLWSGFALQLWGLEFTTPAKSAFFTSISSLWVPIILWAFGKPVSLRVWIGFAVATLGLAVLVEGGFSWGYGEGLTLVGSIAFAMQILALDRFGKQVDGNKITPGLFLTNLVLSLLVLAGIGLTTGTHQEIIGWAQNRLMDQTTAVYVGLMVLFPTLLSYSLMNKFQPMVSAEKAAIIYLLEPIFSFGFSLLFGLDQLHVSMLVGGGLVLCGVIFVETQKSDPKPPEIA